MPYYKNVGMSTVRYRGVTIEPGCTEYLKGYVFTDSLLLTEKPEEDEPKKNVVTRRKRRQVSQLKEVNTEPVDSEPSVKQDVLDVTEVSADEPSSTDEETVNDTPTDASDIK